MSTMRDGRHDLFVYGTLLSGEPAHHLLGDARLVHAEAYTTPTYELVDLGGYPGMVEPGATRIRGEVYSVAAAIFAVLDDYEDAHDEYDRRVIVLAGGHEALTYIYRGEQAGTPIPSGDWRARE